MLSIRINISSQLHRDAAAALVGSLGLVPSINAGDHFVMGEPYVAAFQLPHIQISLPTLASTALHQTLPEKESQTLWRPFALLHSCFATLGIPREQTD